MSESPATENTPDVTMADVAHLSAMKERIQEALSRRIVGMEDVIDQMLIALFARGHCLFIGVPGLAKTLLISTLSESLGLGFKRIQFTPDLMPSDITGTDVLEEDPVTGKRTFQFAPGPIFCNLLLADEVNRTPPKTQAALLQAMQEGVVTASGHSHPLDAPFHVFATQNPIEQEGTYPLPEAQLDRFMLSINVGYPTFDQEVAIVRQTTGHRDVQVDCVVTRDELLRAQAIVRAIVVAPEVTRYAVRLATQSRPGHADAPADVQKYVSWGAGPRASQYLVLGAKARAAMAGRPHASFEDVAAMANSVLSHRLSLNFQAEAERVRAPDLVQAIVDQTPIHS